MIEDVARLEQRYRDALHRADVPSDVINSLIADINEKFKMEVLLRSGSTYDDKWKRADSIYDAIVECLSKVPNVSDIEVASVPPIIARIFPTELLYAEVKRYPEGYLILVGNGVSDLLVSFLSILFRTEGFFPNGPKYLRNGMISEEQSDVLFAQLFAGYLLYGPQRGTGLIGWPHLPIRYSEDPLYYFYLNTLFESHTFVIAHEFFHIILNHFGRDAVVNKSEDNVADRTAWKNELDADWHATHYMYNSERIRLPGGPSMREVYNGFPPILESVLAGIIVFFVIDHWHNYFAENANKLRGVEEQTSQDHPPSALRLNHLLNELVTRGHIKSENPDNWGFAGRVIAHLNNREKRLWPLVAELAF